MMKIGSLFGIPVIGGDVLFCFFGLDDVSH